MNPTKASVARARATELERIIGHPTLERRPGAPLFPINTYTEDVILADTRVTVESVLREKGDKFFDIRSAPLRLLMLDT